MHGNQLFKGGLHKRPFKKVSFLTWVKKFKICGGFVVSDEFQRIDEG